ncbi:MAG: hypothetical protein ACI4Q7_02380 [Candidatus Avelusimicrobium sp.]
MKKRTLHNSCVLCGAPCDQKYCADCRIQKKREWVRKAYERKHPNAKKYCPRNRNVKIQGLTFSFTGGKWFWKHTNGLTNGPFDSFGSARNDAKKAFCE